MIIYDDDQANSVNVLVHLWGQSAGPETIAAPDGWPCGGARLLGTREGPRIRTTKCDDFQGGARGIACRRPVRSGTGRR